MVYDPIAKKEYDRKRNARQKEEFLKKNPEYGKKKKNTDENPVKIETGGFDIALKNYYETKPLTKIRLKSNFVSPLEKAKPEKEDDIFDKPVINPSIKFYD